MSNGANGGTSVTAYDDQENPVMFKALPIMDLNEENYDFTSMFFSGNNDGVFNAEQLGNSINSSVVFKYPQCVIDLNPGTG